MAKVASFPKVDAAVVRLPRLGGWGVLVAGGYILTAARCVHAFNSADIALGDHCLEDVETANDMQFRLAVVAVEPVADIAVLGAPDNQQFFEDVDQFDEFQRMAAPVSTQHLQPTKAAKEMEGLTLDVWVRNLNRQWISAKVRLPKVASPVSYFDFTEPIDGGMAGGPIIDAEGNLFAILATAEQSGSGPRPRLTLPAWLLREISFAEQIDKDDQSQETVKGR